MKNPAILLPSELTAENGAKKLLIGEFFEEIESVCSECAGDGYETWDGIFDEVCEACNGAGVITIKVPVSWTTIKSIYKKIVEHYGEQASNT